jgi:hypothetical protein
MDIILHAFKLFLFLLNNFLKIGIGSMKDMNMKNIVAVKKIILMNIKINPMTRIKKLMVEV